MDFHQLKPKYPLTTVKEIITIKATQRVCKLKNKSTEMTSWIKQRSVQNTAENINNG